MNFLKKIYSKNTTIVNPFTPTGTYVVPLVKKIVLTITLPVGHTLSQPPQGVKGVGEKSADT